MNDWHPEVQSVNLTHMAIPPAILQMMPEAVARDNLMIPFALDNGVLRIAMRDPYDFDTILKVQFLLARDIQPALAPEEQIVAALQRHYGPA